jgi:Ni,Fe-hydrogenase III small subunit
MPAGYQEIFLEQGTDFTTTITLDDVNGVPYDLTGVTAKSQVKKSYYSSTPITQFAVSISPDATKGIITLDLTSSTTSNIAAGRYVYDVLIKDSANSVTRILEGTLNVLPQVTKF